MVVVMMISALFKQSINFNSWKSVIKKFLYVNDQLEIGFLNKFIYITKNEKTIKKKIINKNYYLKDIQRSNQQNVYL